MSLARCIPDLVKRGKITPEQGKKALEIFDEMAAEARGAMAPDAADALASANAVKAIDFEALRKRRNTLRQIGALHGAEAWVRGGGEQWGRGAKGKGPGGPLPGEGEKGPVNPVAARTLIGRVEARRQVIEGMIFAHMDDVLAELRSTVTGKLRNPALMDELGAAAFGEEAPLAAKELAQSWHSASEYGRLRFNAAGGDIGELKNRGFSQHHDSRKVAEAGFDRWFADESDRLDRARIVDEETGQPFGANSWREFMHGVFETIASDGAVDRKAGAAGGMSFANRMGEHRVLHYKSYADWKASQAQYGAGTAYDAMMGEVKGMARAIAAMEILGPNPEATVRVVKDLVTGDKSLFEPGQLRKRDKAGAQAIAVQRLWDEYTGALRQPESRALAAFFSGYRAIASSAKLGGSPLTAIGDVGFGMATRHFNDLPVVGIMGDYLKYLKPGSEADYRKLARMGFVAETWTSRVSAQSRFLAEEIFSEKGSRVAETVLRVSGLNGITDAGRATNDGVWLLHLTNERGKAFGALEPGIQGALHRHGIDAKGWDAIRSTPLEEDWIKPGNVADRELGNRLAELIHNERDFAVPVPDLETRAYINANWRKGNLLGELIRSSPLMFKTFTVSMMIRHGGRMVQQRGIGGKLGYFLSVLVPVTVVSAFALQLKEMAKGRDPRPMDPNSNEGRQFWGQAMVQGGGMGIVGDLLGLSAENRMGGWDEYAAGPLASDLGRLAAGLTGEARNALHGLGMNVKRDDRANWKLLQSLHDNVPGQSVWYSRLVLDRLLTDQIQSLTDPRYRQSWQSVARSARDQGTGFWWAPGETSPERAPDLSNPIEGAKQ